jgi:rhodanese-related sulfurtransferase
MSLSAFRSGTLGYNAIAMNSPFSHISPAEVRQQLEDGRSFQIVDVRNRWEYDHRHIPQVLLMPMGEFAQRCQAELSPSAEIVLLCEHGVRSQSAAQYLASLGYTHVATMTGGMAAYDGPTEGEE